MSNRATCGGSTSLGSSRSTAETLSRTSWAACSTSFSSTNWIRTCPTFSMLVERMALIPAMPETASSSLVITLVSIASGSAPG